MARVALITGITGQDGWYLTELLLGKGYEVHGVVTSDRGADCHAHVQLHYADLVDGSNFWPLLEAIQPDEIYNLAAQSHVGRSFELPLHTANVTGVGPLRLLETTRNYQLQTGREVRFFQAASSEIFGQTEQSPQNETTPFHPRSPYACAKVFAYWQTVNYREAYGLFACNGILFNHESPRRGEGYVTRKITRAAARIKLGLQRKLLLGNLEARRDWGFAGDFVDAMWRMLQQDEPDDYVIASGETHSVREFLDEVFGYLDLDWHDHVEVDPRFYRPVDVQAPCGDATKARRRLDWEPRVSFRELARMMAQHDLELARRG